MLKFRGWICTYHYVSFRKHWQENRGCAAWNGKHMHLPKLVNASIYGTRLMKPSQTFRSGISTQNKEMIWLVLKDYVFQNYVLDN